MKQPTFDSLSYTAKKKQTRREKFPSEMDRGVPWAPLLALVEGKRPPTAPSYVS